MFQMMTNSANMTASASAAAMFSCANNNSVAVIMNAISVAFIIFALISIIAVLSIRLISLISIIIKSAGCLKAHTFALQND